MRTVILYLIATAAVCVPASRVAAQTAQATGAGLGAVLDPGKARGALTKGLGVQDLGLLIGLALGSAVALISAAVPALLAARLRVATALGGHGAA